MMKFMTISLVLSLAMMAGCDSKEKQNAAPTAAEVDEHGHDPAVHAGESKESHEGHEHENEAAGHEHHAGEKHDLGTTKVGGFEVTASYSGKINPGEPVDVDLSLKGDRNKLAAVRSWIGAQDARGSMKDKAVPEGEGYHAEVEAPEPMPEGAALWVEIETNLGDTQTGSLALK